MKITLDKKLTTTYISLRNVFLLISGADIRRIFVKLCAFGLKSITFGKNVAFSTLINL